MDTRSLLSFSSKLTVPVTRRDHAIGPPDAPVTLVEYGDFECPYSALAVPLIDQLIEIYGPHLHFAYRHFPLTQIHPGAEQSAEASEAAAAEGKFWEMHHLLFRKQEELDEFSLINFAERMGLEPKRFTLALRTEKHRPRVEQDFISGIRSGVNGTPTFFLNDEKYEGEITIPALSQAIDRLLQGQEIL